MADTLPADAIIWWPSTHASIPSGFSRITAYDEKYFQGDDSGFSGSSNGGNSSAHSHTIPVHNHTSTLGHNHRFSAGNTSMTTDSEQTTTKPTIKYTITFQHYHVQKNSAQAYVTTASSTGYSSDATTEDRPPSIKMIALRPTSGDRNIPDGAFVLHSGTSAPSGYVLAAGSTATGAVNAIDKYLIGADSGSGDGGASITGASTHSHADSTGHTHTANHSHSAVSCGSASTLNAFKPLSIPSPQTLGFAHHNVSLNTSSAVTTTSTSTSSNSITTDPNSKYLLGIQNVSGSTQTIPTGMICGYDGTIGSIPSGWQLADGTNGTTDCTNQQIKCTASSAAVGTKPNSSDTHTHNFTHNHDVPAHTHSESVTDVLTAIDNNSGITITDAAAAHTHTWTVNNSSATGTDTDDATTTADDIRRSYRTMVWIQKVDVTVTRRVMVL